MLRNPAALPANPDVVKLLCENGGNPRLAIRGTSMHPLLREPMVLQLDRFSGTPRFGDVLVFSERERLVAHRFVSTTKDGRLVLAGDAVRQGHDIVARDAVIGVVGAVWSGPGEGAKRIDGRVHLVLGILAACRSALRMRFRAPWQICARALAQANPRRRPRAYLALFAALGAIVRTDAAALRRHITSVDPYRLLAAARLHRCGPILIDGLEALNAVDALPGSAIEALRKERWATAVRCLKLGRQVEDVIGICAAAGVVPILLKGAARIFTGESDSVRHRSEDLDILLPHDGVATATTALQAAGYREVPGEAQTWHELAHHAPPLFNQAAGIPIELHYALAHRDAMRARTDFQSLASHIRYVDAKSGPVGILDDYAGALHSAIHAREPTPLRNIVVLAHQLRRLSSSQRAALFAFADGEDLEKNRIQSALHGACLLASLPSFADAAARRHFAWRLRRYDLPFELSRRSQAIDWIVATSGRAPIQILQSFLAYEDTAQRTVPQPLRSLRYACIMVANCIAVAVGAAYAALMPQQSVERELAGADKKPEPREIAQ